MPERKQRRKRGWTALLAEGGRRGVRAPRRAGASTLSIVLFEFRCRRGFVGVSQGEPLKILLARPADVVGTNPSMGCECDNQTSTYLWQGRIMLGLRLSWRCGPTQPLCRTTVHQGRASRASHAPSTPGVPELNATSKFARSAAPPAGEAGLANQRGRKDFLVRRSPYQSTRALAHAAERQRCRLASLSAARAPTCEISQLCM